MKTLYVMDSSGDSRIEFDENDVASKATQEAKALFDRMSNTGAVFAIGSNKRVKNFEELEQDNVVIPRVVGG